MDIDNVDFNNVDFSSVDFSNLQPIFDFLLDPGFLSIIFILILAIFFILSVVLVYHWLLYGFNLKIATAAVLYFGGSLVFLGLIFSSFLNLTG